MAEQITREDARKLKRELLVVGQMLRLADWKCVPVDIFKAYFDGDIECDSVGISYMALWRIVCGLEEDGILKGVPNRILFGAKGMIAQERDNSEYSWGAIDDEEFGEPYIRDIRTYNYVLTKDGLIWAYKGVRRRVSLDVLGKGFKKEFRERLDDIVKDAHLLNKAGELKE